MHPYNPVNDGPGQRNEKKLECHFVIRGHPGNRQSPTMSPFSSSGLSGWAGKCVSRIRPTRSTAWQMTSVWRRCLIPLTIKSTTPFQVSGGNYSSMPRSATRIEKSSRDSPSREGMVRTTIWVESEASKSVRVDSRCWVVAGKIIMA